MRKLIIFVLLSFCAPMLLAQDADQNDAASSAQASPETSQSELGDGDDLIAAEIDVTNEDEEESSVRFIPTEEISQDLGVSFPIDI